MILILKKMYQFVCELLYWIGPVILAPFMVSAYVNTSQMKAYKDQQVLLNTCQSTQKLHVKEISDLKALRKTEESISLQAQESKGAASKEACKSKIKIIEHDAVAPKAGTDLLKQELPDDLLKEIDPSYRP